jgi:hypothetical protein
VDRCLFAGAYKTGRDVYVERDLPGKANPWLSKRRRIAKAQKVLSAASRDGFTAARKTNAIQPINVFTVEEYESNGKTQKKWTKIGAAFPHKEGLGFSIELRAFPVDGRLVVLPPDTDEGNGRNGK